MKKLNLKNQILIWLLISIPYCGNAQDGFNVKKKNPTNINTASLNAVRINGSKTSSKSQQTKRAVSKQPGQLNKFSKSLQKVILSTETNLPIFIQSNPDSSFTEKTLNIDKTSSCFKYLNELAPVLKIEDPQNQFIIKNTLIDEFSNTHIRMNQVYKGIPVHRAQIIVHLDKNGRGKLLNGRYFTIGNDINTSPSITSDEAILKASNNLISNGKKPENTFVNTQFADLVKPQAKLIIYNNRGIDNNYVLAYQVEIYSSDHHQWDYYIDAQNGSVIYKLESTCSADGSKTANANDLNGVSRSINTYQKGSTYYLLDVTKPMFDAVNSVIPDDPKGAIMTIDMDNTFGENRTFKYIISPNNVWGSATAVSAHYNAGVAYEYYLTKHGRNSIDGVGGTIYSIINVPDEDTGGPLDNAFWSGRFMWYGNGNVSFKPLAGGLDVAGHEMTHGVVENTAGLEYDGESGAINESIADIFGAMMDNSDWQLGEDVVLTSVFHSGAMRDLSDPHNGGFSLSDRGYQPNHINEKYTGEQDNHGVHINSGISNHAYYLFATAIGKENAANVYYKALTVYLTKSSQFIDLRIAVIQAATDLFGSGSNEVTQAGIAFDAVGITNGSGTNVNSSLPVNPGDEYILVYNTDVIDVNTLYRSDNAKTLVEALTSTTFLSRPSITDDGSIAVFVAGDNTLSAIYTTPELEPQEVTIQDEQIWSNVVVSKDGNRLAAVTTDVDTLIWVYDFISEIWGSYKLYNPSYTEGINAPGPLYADALEWDYTGENLVYDCFNSFNNSDGQDIEYWDVNFIHVWDNNAGYFGDGTVSKLFSSIPDNVSIGNPSFAKNSPNIVAFDYIDSGLNEYSILGCNVETSDVNKIIDNNTLGWPSYNKEDNRLAFTTINVDDNLQSNYTVLGNDKISSDGNSTGIFGNTKWPVYFATGVRDLHVDIKGITSIINKNELLCYPNPFNDLITVKINPELFAKGNFEVINQLGQIVKEGDYILDTDNELKLDLSRLRSGYYIIRIHSDSNTSIGRIIKN